MSFHPSSVTIVQQQDEPLNSGSQAVMLMQILDAAMKFSERNSAVTIQPIT